MSIISPRAAEFAEATATYVVRAFAPHEADSRFIVHVRANRLKRLLVFVAFLVVQGLQFLKSGFVLDPNDVKALFFIQQHNDWNELGMFRLPIGLFSIFAFFAFWSVYHNYVVIIHSRVINWATRYSAAAAVICCVIAFALSLASNSQTNALIALAASYIFGTVFSYFLTSSLKKYEPASPLPLAMSAATHWCFVNLVTAFLFFMVLFVFPPEPELVTRSPLWNALLAFYVLLYVSIALTIVISSVRAGLLLKREAYLKEIESFNMRIDECGGASGLSGTPAGSHPSPTDLAPPIPSSKSSRVIALLEMMRFGGSLAVAALVWMLTDSGFYAATVFFFFAFSFVVNDIFDFISTKDCIGHPSRPLPSGRAAVPEALTLCIVLFTSGLFSAVFSENDTLTLLSVLYTVSLVYSWFLKRLLPLIASPVWCCAMTVLVLWPITSAWSNYLITFLFLYSRELLLDFEDIDCDDKFAIICSLPSLLGRHTFTAVFALVALAGLVGWFEANFVVVFAAASLVAVCVAILSFSKNLGRATAGMTTVMMAYMVVIFSF